LAERLVYATKWAKQQKEIGDLGIGYFGSSTGGGAALVAAAELPNEVGAVVSRGGRPDLAGEALPKVKAPTLLIVGGEDHVVMHPAPMPFFHLFQTLLLLRSQQWRDLAMRFGDCLSDSLTGVATNLFQLRPGLVDDWCNLCHLVVAQVQLPAQTVLHHLSRNA